MHSMLNHAILILLLPLASAAVIALFLRKQGALASWISTATAGAIAAISIILLLHGERFEAQVEWLRFGDFAVSLGIKYDDLAALMLFIVGFVGFLIHVFSLGYMHEDQARARFFGGLSIFMFSMIGIVLANNLFMIFIFWELVGFSSWLLINHYHEKQSAADAAKKAFIVNRVGDFGFLLGIIMCYWANGTVNLTELGEFGAAHRLVFSTAIPLLLFCGAMGKSAQMPLQVWLPDAMEGPTPVSALIHAATMVAAGIFMLCRINVLMVPEALEVIMWIGTITALYAALCAIVQRDIKKVLAYSTLSQLGYMVAAFGLGNSDKLPIHMLPAAPDGGDVIREVLSAGAAAAMFHLTTHAFFKALLFLGSGSVIMGCHHEQDIFKMGGLRSKMPVTFFTFTIGVLAIIGMPFLAGFFSKDAILYLAMEKNTAVFAILAFTAVLTAFYMVRLWKITFLGEARSDDAKHAHESGMTMTLPLILLAMLSVVGGYAGVYGKLAGPTLVLLVPEAEGSAHTTILLVSLAVMTLGAGSALFFYKSAATDTLEEKSHVLFAGLTWLKESFDRLYDYYVAKVQQRFAMVLNFLEQIVLAGAIIRGLAGFVGYVGYGARALYTGSLHTYVFWFLLGAALLWAYAAGVF
ncbi:proton-conducting transporter membrane subunit [Opitutus sp. GAS368]|jgi:NADH-quinone oxidoreductase subunit L|uniref:NADH-quinone oxidoreductase subunit 5 family protein n=1 Tax=Opitutus sp. GAS368 TaxID=1882749 RepID=UPI00087C3F8F|nr:proton-conducting transporter membrane subunit [Opitutus sp. GAS368]SDS14378.1 NADH-quinone oxidoreductase subunit L [Opitutus sp. GAS368]